MDYRFKYNERPHFENEERHDDHTDIPSAKAVRDTLVEEQDGVIVKSRRQTVCGREYIVCAEFGISGTAKLSDLLKQAIDLAEDAKKLSA